MPEYSEDKLKRLTCVEEDVFISKEDTKHFLNAEAEARDLRRIWYSHFLSIMEKLADNLESVSSEFHDYKDKIHREIFTSREILRKEINSAKVKGDLDIEKLEERVERSIAALSKVVEGLDSTKDIEELRAEILSIKYGLSLKIEESMTKHEKEVSIPFNDSLTTLKTKIAVWTVFAAVFISTVVSLSVWLVKDYIKKIFLG